MKDIGRMHSSNRRNALNEGEELADRLDPGVLRARSAAALDAPQGGSRDSREFGELVYLGVLERLQQSLDLSVGSNDREVHMTRIVSHSEGARQPDLEGSARYRFGMADVRKILWKNLEALMTSRWGGVNLSRLGREAKIGPSGAHRLKEQHQSSGIVLVEDLAEVFKLEAWQLLHPEMRSSPPLSDHAMSVAEMFDRVPVERQAWAYAVISQVLEFGNTGRSGVPFHAPSDDPPAPPETPPATTPPVQPTRRAPSKAQKHR